MPHGARRVRVLSTKFDGSPHNDYLAELVEAGDGNTAPLRLFVPIGTLVQSESRGAYTIATPFTQLFWPGHDRWWNLEHNHRPHRRTSGGLMLSYANVSTPAEFDGETVRWVDLDLDVIVSESGPELVDEDEFEEHQVRFGYPADVIARAYAAAGELLELAARGMPPFDREAWISESK